MWKIRDEIGVTTYYMENAATLYFIKNTVSKLSSNT